jgi:hypothetical protein
VNGMTSWPPSGPVFLQTEGLRTMSEPETSEVVTLTDGQLAEEIRAAHAKLRAVTLETVAILHASTARYEAVLRRAIDAGLDVTEGEPKKFHPRVNLSSVVRDKLRAFEDPDAPLPETSGVSVRRVTITDL